MTILFRKNPGDRVLELGGGSNPDSISDVNIDIRPCADAQGNPTVHFIADFEKPFTAEHNQAIADNDFDGVIAKFSLEHVSWTRLPDLLREVLRIIKPGGRACFVLPDTESQMKWIQTHPEGWDGKGVFEAASELLFGTQSYTENTHKVYLSPSIMCQLLQEAGFGSNILVQPYNDRGTDMVIECGKPWEKCGVIGPQGVVCILPRGHIRDHKGELGYVE